jgi:single-stranded-DNA-specific exonuclease
VAGLEAAGYGSLISRLLASRGIGPELAASYLNPTIGDLAKPCELPGVAEAAEVVLSAVVRGERIVIFGDYDCDGVCATAILMCAIGALAKDGAKPSPFLPERLSEGYGMTSASVSRMLSENPGVKLVVTVDNGINAVEEVASLRARGISVVVTDHHLPGEILPAADALVNPKVAAPLHLEGLCGAGVSFMLANAVVTLARERGLFSGPSIGGPLLVLAGLATVTDIMPLTWQNRVIVAEALRRFRSLAPLGLKELHSRVSRSVAPVLTTKDFGFQIGPRINAAGRMASGTDALKLVLASDREEARELARIVDVRNVERKTVEQAMLDEALSKIVPGAAAQVIDLPDGHQGVAGIVASRVLERLGADAVPVCVVVKGHGSARAPEGYNLRDGFEHAAEALARFGGHAAAGGFSVREGELERFRTLFCEGCAKQLAGSPERRNVSVLDLWLSPSDITLDMAERVQAMEPFGEANPEPIFGLKSVQIAEVRPLGAEGRHLLVGFRDRAIPKAIWWNRGDLVEELRGKSSDPYDVVFTLEISDYIERHVELRIVDVSPSVTRTPTRL